MPHPDATLAPAPQPAPPPAPQLIRAALRCRCPACGRGALLQGLLTVRPACPQCGLDLRGHDTGDGAAVGVILVLGALIVALALWTELRFAPPLWLHALIWPLVTLPAAILLMRPAKAALIALQYRHRRAGIDD